MRVWRESALVGLSAFVLLLGLLLWLDNVHMNTSNGMWKSIDVEGWKLDFRAARLDASNYLYYPLSALSCRLLDALGIWPTQVWRQLALINTAWAAVALAIVYWLAWRLTGRRDVAAIAVLVHLGSGFFLSLAVSNEDIMPGYTLVLAAMATAAVWFSAPAPRQVALVAVLFALGWLIEWRLMFPALPPLLLALALSRGSLARRAALIVLFLAVMVGVALLAANRWEGHSGAVGLPGLLWTGKAVHSGWGGFSAGKLALLVAGMGEYFLGAHQIASTILFSSLGAEWALSFALQMLLLAAVGTLLWRRRYEPAQRTVAIVFLGTLAAGEFMNAYSQPQDPQMQINVMPWLTVAVALLLAEALATARSPQRLIRVAAAVALLPLAYNLVSFSAARGRDSEMEAALEELEHLVDPARTVFIYTGWENILSWQFLEWQHRWDGVCDLDPAPLAVPKFKWISLFSPAVHHPSWTPAEHVAAVRAEIECAFDKGYRVVAGPIWAGTAEQLANRMTPLKASDRGLALHAMLHAVYEGRPIGGPVIDNTGSYYEITRR